MKKIITLLFFFFYCGTISLIAGESLTKKDVEDFMAGAVQFAQKNGKDLFYAEIVNPNGPFIREQLYIAAMTNDIKVIAHGVKPHINGTDMSRLTDKNGVNIGKAYMEAMKRGDGWCEYYWPNPVTGVIQRKFGYGVRLDKDTWLLTGFYP